MHFGHTRNPENASSGLPTRLWGHKIPRGRPGQSPGRKKVRCILFVIEAIWWKQNSICLLIFWRRDYGISLCGTVHNSVCVTLIKSWWTCFSSDWIDLVKQICLDLDRLDLLSMDATNVCCVVYTLKWWTQADCLTALVSLVYGATETARCLLDYAT